MPAKLPVHYTDLDAAEREILVPLSGTDRSLGCVSVTVRELPYAVRKSAELRLLAASVELEQSGVALKSLVAGERTYGTQLDDVGLAYGALRSAHLEVIRWGVVGHKASDFLQGDREIPFETAKASLSGVIFDVASPRMLRLYAALSPSSLDGARFGFLSLLCIAVREFQVGRVSTPEEIWADAEREADKKKESSPSPSPSALPSNSASDSASS